MKKLLLEARKEESGDLTSALSQARQQERLASNSDRVVDLLEGILSVMEARLRFEASLVVAGSSTGASRGAASRGSGSQGARGRRGGQGASGQGSSQGVGGQGGGRAESDGDFPSN